MKDRGFAAGSLPLRSSSKICSRSPGPVPLAMRGSGYCWVFLNLCEVFRIVLASAFCLLISFNAGGTELPLLELKANTKTFCIYSNCTSLRVVRRGEIFQ